MKRKKTIAILFIIAAIAIVLTVRVFSFTGTYIAWFDGVEPLGGGSYALVLGPDGTGRVGQSPESSRPFTYQRTGNRLEVTIDWESRGGDVYVFEVKPARLVSLGHRLASGDLNKSSGYVFLMRGKYYKRPI